MKVVSSLRDVPATHQRRSLVPTMGALHEGHLSLMRKARQEADEVVVSIFVNPTQFGPHEDFNRYPRPFERDLELASSVGVDWVFAPTPEEMYPRRTTRVHVDDVTLDWEGARRPGHFDGVATVVLKLFQIVRPDSAVFGWKDLQQCLVVRRMVEDLNVPVRLIFAETHREPDGLAMSSRNAYLNQAERAIAPELHRSLQHIAECARSKKSSPAREIEAQRERLTQCGFEVDYLAFVDGGSLETIDEWRRNSAIIVAAKLGATRLIDNLRID